MLILRPPISLLCRSLIANPASASFSNSMKAYLCCMEKELGQSGDEGRRATPFEKGANGLGANAGNRLARNEEL